MKNLRITIEMKVNLADCLWAIAAILAVIL
jgi:hypothetical protein